MFDLVAQIYHSKEGHRFTTVFSYLSILCSQNPALMVLYLGFLFFSHRRSHVWPPSAVAVYSQPVWVSGSKPVLPGRRTQISDCCYQPTHCLYTSSVTHHHVLCWWHRLAAAYYCVFLCLCRGGCLQTSIPVWSTGWPTWCLWGCTSFWSITQLPRTKSNTTLSIYR